MAIPVMTVSRSGPAPQVKVVIGFANLASYTIAMVPPDLDFSKAKAFVTADDPDEVDDLHPLPAAWVDQDEWFVVAVGGIGAAGNTAQFSADASLIQGGQEMAMITTLSEAAAAATFVSSIQIRVQS